MNEFMWWLEYVCCLFIYLLSTSIFNIIYLLLHIYLIIGSLSLSLSFYVLASFFVERERASFLQPRVCVCVCVTSLPWIGRNITLLHDRTSQATGLLAGFL